MLSLPATVVVAALMLPASTVRAWPVSPSIESVPCEPGPGCSSPPATAPPESGAAAAPAGTSATAADAGPASPAATPAGTSPPATTVVAAPVADAEEPRVVRVRQAPSSRAAPAAVAAAVDPELVPDRILMLDVGLHTVVGQGSANFYPGLRAGLLLGGRLGPQFSGNAELVIDVLNPDTPEGISISELFFDLTFSPLVHAPISLRTQFILGPKLGVFTLTESASVEGQSATVWGWGWAVGANAGVLTWQGSTRLGFLASFHARNPVKVCVDTSTAPERCISEGFRASKMLSLAFAAML